MSDIAQRITDYLTSGGLWNPEMADHDKVRELLIDCRDLAALEAQFWEKAVALANDPNVQSLATYRCRGILALHAEIEKRIEAPQMIGGSNATR